jgi:hypothetical protein
MSANSTVELIRVFCSGEQTPTQNGLRTGYASREHHALQEHRLALVNARRTAPAIMENAPSTS